MSARLLVLDDDAGVRQALSDYLSLRGYDIVQATSISACCDLVSKESFALLLLDYRLPDGDALGALERIKRLAPDVPVVVLTGHASIELAVHAIKQGAEQFLTKPLQLSVVEHTIRSIVDARRVLRRQAAATVSRVHWERDPFVGRSPRIRALESAVRKVLGTARPILIQGETGTGKGVLAHWMHTHGPRSAEPFVDVNCAGLPRDLVESELFGHEKGAFTGALQSKPGLIETAHLGTLFLDEIGDLDLPLQPKLLTALEERRVRRLGQLRDRIVDIHLIAATHHDLAEMVDQQKFRADLFFRINTITLQIPPLRERPEDIPILSEFFLRQLERDLGRGPFTIGEEVRSSLQSYRWPGNIRELRNVLERAALISEHGEIRQADLDLRQSRRTPDAALKSPQLTLAEWARQHINQVLEEEAGNVNRAAMRLGVPRSTLYAKLRNQRNQTPDVARA